MHAWRQDNFAGVLNRHAGSEVMLDILKFANKKPLNVLYSELELLGRIQMSEWVKLQPCRGYGRLLVAVALSTVLGILYLISQLTCLETVICFHPLNTPGIFG